MEKTHRKAINLLQLSKIAEVSYDRVAKAFHFGDASHLKDGELEALSIAMAEVQGEFSKFLRS